jgi:hypothetical protein
MTTTTNNMREHKGQAIAHLQGSVNRIDEHTYKVKSQSDNDKEYDIISSELDGNAHVLIFFIVMLSVNMFLQ